jgi:hypothetical protein
MSSLSIDGSLRQSIDYGKLLNIENREGLEANGAYQAVKVLLKEQR